MIRCFVTAVLLGFTQAFSPILRWCPGSGGDQTLSAAGWRDPSSNLEAGLLPSQKREKVHMADETGSIRILWVGNSFTFFPMELGGIPGVLNLLADAAGTDSFDVTPVLKGGATLHDLADLFESTSRIHSPSVFDLVVLQDHSTVPAGCLVEEDAPAPDDSYAKCLKALQERYAPILKEMQQENGTKVLLYQTWGRDADMHGRPESLGDFEEMSKKLAEGYMAYADVLIAEGVQVNIAGVGDAYVRLRRLPTGPEIWPKLCHDSNAHPTALAALLIASTFAATLAQLTKNASLFPSKAAVIAVGQRLELDLDDLNALCNASGLTALSEIM